jgi:GxxExxY protein
MKLQKTTEPKLQRVDFLYGDLSYKINGILIEAYKELGPYAKEKQYSNLLQKKFNEKRLKFQKEVRIGDSGNIIDFIIDFIIEGVVALELKTVPFLIKEHFDQIKRYLHITNLKVGILVNFRVNYLSPKRVLNQNNFK